MASEVGAPEVSGATRVGAAPGVLVERPKLARWARAINGVGRGLARVGVGPAGLEDEELLEKARRRTGLSDFGDEDFREPMRVLLKAWKEEADLTPIGRFVFREYALLLLANRLKIQDDLKRHPEILDVPVPRPLIVTGFPRSGTTLLHNLLSQDPEARPLLFWEMRMPSPPPARETYKTDPRIAKAKMNVRVLKALAPTIASAHELDAEAPEECNGLFENAFASVMLTLIAHVPSYAEWLKQCDKVPAHRYYRRQLQLLSWRVSGSHWALKAPAHLFNLGSLLEVFPDACIVQNHRDPLEMIASLCSLGATIRGAYAERVDLGAIGSQFLDGIAAAAERAMAVRETADPARFYDVHYRAFVADPVGTVRNICRYFDYPFSDEMERRIRDWLARNPQHKHGVHRYTLERFGLDRAMVDERFAAYRAWAEKMG